jgi:hypothetical protein
MAASRASRHELLNKGWSPAARPSLKIVPYARPKSHRSALKNIIIIFFLAPSGSLGLNQVEETLKLLIRRQIIHGFRPPAEETAYIGTQPSCNGRDNAMRKSLDVLVVLTTAC